MPRDVRRLAFRFVLTIGIVNFFPDLTYEGARSIKTFPWITGRERGNDDCNKIPVTI